MRLIAPKNRHIRRVLWLMWAGSQPVSHKKRTLDLQAENRVLTFFSRAARRKNEKIILGVDSGRQSLTQCLLDVNLVERLMKSGS